MQCTYCRNEYSNTTLTCPYKDCKVSAINAYMSYITSQPEFKEEVRKRYTNYLMFGILD